MLRQALAALLRWVVEAVLIDVAYRTLTFPFRYLGNYVFGEDEDDTTEPQRSTADEIAARLEEKHAAAKAEDESDTP